MFLLKLFPNWCKKCYCRLLASSKHTFLVGDVLSMDGSTWLKKLVPTQEKERGVCKDYQVWVILQPSRTGKKLLQSPLVPPSEEIGHNDIQQTISFVGFTGIVQTGLFSHRLASNVWWITPCEEHDEFSHPFWVVWFCNECDAVWLTRMEAFKLTSYYYSVVDNYHMLIQHSGLMATGQVLLYCIKTLIIQGS